MKKYLITSFSLLSVMFLNSCDTNNDNFAEPGKNSLIVKEDRISLRELKNKEIELGELHNEVLENYYSKYGFDEDISSIRILNERLLAINKEMYPEYFGNITLEQLVMFTEFLYGGDATVDNFDFKESGEVILQMAVEENVISLKFKNFIVNLINKNDNAMQSIASVNRFMSENELSEREIGLLEDFKSVVSKSDEFWNINNNFISSRAIGGCNPKHQIRLADGYGTVIGGAMGQAVLPGIGGMIGSAIGGQGMSALIEHMQQRNGGKCI